MMEILLIGFLGIQIFLTVRLMVLGLAHRVAVLRWNLCKEENDQLKNKIKFYEKILEREKDAEKAGADEYGYNVS